MVLYGTLSTVLGRESAEFMVAVRVTVVDYHFVVVIWQSLGSESEVEENLESKFA